MSKDHQDPPNGHDAAHDGDQNRHGHPGEHARGEHRHSPSHDDPHKPAGTHDKRATGQPEAESSPSAELDTLKASLGEKEKEIAELKDKYLRAVAEMDNTRKRLRQQSEENVRRERENLLREVLPVIDNLERAVAAARGSGDGKSIIEGVEMVLRSMLDMLKAQGVTPIESIGQVFDPARHEAVDHVASGQHPANTVIQEHHRGYLSGDRILRPARVSVSKASEERRIDGENDPTDVENR